MMTQCITAAVLFGAGDVIAQQAVEGKGRNHDVSDYFRLHCG
jgi:protein Mpv17